VQDGIKEEKMARKAEGREDTREVKGKPAQVQVEGKGRDCRRDAYTPLRHKGREGKCRAGTRQ
jgi:hypothetical protein